MVQGLLGLLKLCPQEVAHLRKELLIAARHILSTELRNSMCSCLLSCLLLVVGTLECVLLLLLLLPAENI